MTAEDLKKEWYKLGTDFSFGAGDQSTFITISGLDEKFDASMALAMNLVKEPKADDETLAELKKIVITQRADSKKNPQTILDALRRYSLWGDQSPHLVKITNAEIEKKTVDELLSLVSGVLSYDQTITYTGSLDNGGEQLVLRDSKGENILSFRFDGDWFPPARGGGHSIDILDGNSDWSAWDFRSSWALSAELNGSPGEVNPRPQRHTYRSWSAQFFTPMELADPLVSAAEADASGDGVPNLIKYALGIDPLIRTRAGLPAAKAESGFLSFSFRRLAKAGDLSLVVEISTDLISWSALTSVATVMENGDGTENLTFRSDLPLSDQPRQFIRLKVIKN